MNPARPFVRPRALRPGGRVALLTLASPAQAADVESAADELRVLGFEPIVMPPAAGPSAPYVSGSGAARAAQLQAVLADDRIGAVIASRGGYGSAQLLPFLDLDAVRLSRTLLVGYSDVTALLDVVTGHAGLVSIHGPMAEGRLARGAEAYQREAFLRTVCEPEPPGVVATPAAAVLQPGDAQGVLRGGTLTQVAALLGTPWAFNAREPTILFLDDVNERPYRIDRLLWQLRQAGVFTHVTGVVFNELPGCDEPGGSVCAHDAVRHALHGFAGPVVTGVPSGHTAGAMLTLPFGVRATLHASGGVRLSIDEAAVQA